MGPGIVFLYVLGSGFLTGIEHTGKNEAPTMLYCTRLLTSTIIDRRQRGISCMVYHTFSEVGESCCLYVKWVNSLFDKVWFQCSMLSHNVFH